MQIDPFFYSTQHEINSQFSCPDGAVVQLYVSLCVCPDNYNNFFKLNNLRPSYLGC